MKNKSIQVFFACFFGALAGACIGRGFGQSLGATFIGIVSGGFAGYLFYDFQKVIQATKTATKTVFVRPKATIDEKEHRKLSRKYNTFRFFSEFANSAFPVNFAGGIVSLIILPIALIASGEHGTVVAVILACIVTLMQLIVGIDAGLGGASSNFNHYNLERMRRFVSNRVDYSEKSSISPFMENIKISTRTRILFCIPVISLIFGIGIAFIHFVKWIALLGKALIKLFGVLLTGILEVPRLLKIVFIAIHSNLRVLCMIDAALGAGIALVCLTGQYAPIFGAIIGGVVGVIQYNIVSIRILKLNPQ